MSAVPGERLARRIARAGLCSRREAERWIEAGRVAVNGTVALTPARNVVGEDRVEVDGRPLPAPLRPRLFRFHKPRGVVTTHRDPQGRPTVFDGLPPGLPHLHAVGRLDIDSEGLLLVTTDGALKRHLELPATGLVRTYRVRCHGRPDPARLARLRQGVTVAKVRYGPVEAKIDRAERANAWLRVSLREGRNREVRRVLAHVGLEVNRLIRVRYGPFRLDRLPRGAWSEVPSRQVAAAAGRAETDPPGRRRGPAAGRERPPRRRD